MFKKKFKHYFLTLITQKAQRTYRRVLEGAVVGVLWSYVVKETGEPRENHDIGRGNTALPHADTGIRSRVAAVASECVNHCTIQATKRLCLVLHRLLYIYYILHIA